MTLSKENYLTPATGHPTPHQAEGADQNLEITVVFTSVPSTLVALREAATLAQSLDAVITLIVPQVVPFPTALEDPPVMREFSEHRFRVMAKDSRVAMNVRICLCRDQLEELKFVLPAGSILVLGGPHRWWVSREERLARGLRRAGYEVIFKETE